MDQDEVEAKRHNPTSRQCVQKKRRLLPDDPFYEDGNIRCDVQYKQMPVEDEDMTGSDNSASEFPCHIPGCSAGLFTTIQDYELHYNSAHKNMCDTCHHVLPFIHQLDIHIMEWHDSLFQVLAEKQPMYSCLLKSCGIKFQTAEERKLHLVGEHRYPKDFRFDRKVKSKGSGNHSKAQSGAQPAHQDEDSMDVGTSSMESPQPGKNRQSQQPSMDASPAQRHYRVPKSICFGRGGVRTFQRLHRPKQQHNKKHHNKQTTDNLQRNTPQNQCNLGEMEQASHQETDADGILEQTVSGHEEAEEAMESQVTMETR